MTHVVNLDSDGVEHIIWMQDKADTCGPACIYMIECNRRQLSVLGGEERIKNITAMLPNGYVEGSGTQAIAALAQTLNTIGINAKAKFENNIATYLDGARLSVIVNISWPGGGGHYAVAVKRTNSNNMVFLDPFYALVEKPQSIGNSYRVISGVLQSGFAARGILSGHIVETG